MGGILSQFIYSHHHVHFKLLSSIYQLHLNKAETNKRLMINKVYWKFFKQLFCEYYGHLVTQVSSEHVRRNETGEPKNESWQDKATVFSKLVSTSYFPSRNLWDSGLCSFCLCWHWFFQYADWEIVCHSSLNLSFLDY